MKNWVFRDDDVSNPHSHSIDEWFLHQDINRIDEEHLQPNGNGTHEEHLQPCDHSIQECFLQPNGNGADKEHLHPYTYGIDKEHSSAYKQNPHRSCLVILEPDSPNTSKAEASEDNIYE